MAFFEKLLEKSLNEFILGFWFNVIGALVGAIIPYFFKIGGWAGVVLGIIVGISLSVILQYEVYIHYLGNDIMKAVKSLCDKSEPMKKLFKQWFRDEIREITDILDGLIKGGTNLNFLESKEKNLKLQLKLIENHIEAQAKASTCLQMWSDRIFPIDIHYSKDDDHTLTYLTLFSDYYKKINGEKARFLLGTPQRYTFLSTNFQRWQELLEYHRRNNVDLYWIYDSSFDIAKHRASFYLEDFCLVKSSELSWVIGRKEMGGEMFLRTSESDIQGIETITTDLKNNHTVIKLV